MNFQKVGETLCFMSFPPTKGFIGTLYFWIARETCILKIKTTYGKTAQSNGLDQIKVFRVKEIWV